MPEKKADKQRYWLTFILKDLDIGATFKPQALHLTIITWFVTEMTDKQVVESFKKTFSSEKVLNLTIGQQDEFKNSHKIAINHIKPSPDLVSLHHKALDWMESLEGRWAVKNPHMGKDFIPHIRRRQGRNLSEGGKLRVDSLSLVRAYRRGDDLRTVAAKVPLL